MTDGNVRAAVKRVYAFSEGDAGMKPLLGGKGANLCEMVKMGIPVPPGFIVTTAACVEHMEKGRFPDGLWEEIVAAVRSLEVQTGKGFGDPAKPLLVAVRSGAVFSMPGMMDTVLNLGINDATAEGLLGATRDERFVLDTRRRFMQMFGDVVLGIEKKVFATALCDAKRENARKRGKDDLASLPDEDVMKRVLDTSLDASDLTHVISAYNAIIIKHHGKPIPADPHEQLRMAVEAVFRSWDNPRAKSYRRMNRISDKLGTAVNVQSMVFGNMGPDSATGVGFTRDPSTGEKVLYGEYLVNAQGEDVVAGIRTPKPLREMGKEMPEQFRQLTDVVAKFEPHFRDMQDFEFTVEKGKLYLLQTRNGKRTPFASVRIALDMVDEGLIDERGAVMRVNPSDLEKLLHPQFDPAAKRGARVIGRGLAASPGAAVGIAVFDSRRACDMREKGAKVVLVRPETNPEDIDGMGIAEGILTSRGGLASHAAVVARGIGKPAVVGAESIRVDEEKRELHAGDVVVREGETVSIDGGVGEVMLGEVALGTSGGITPQMERLLGWAEGYRRMGVRTNADLPKDAEKALEFGAEGIGLCRTEHMFFGDDRIWKVRRMMIAKTTAEREAALAELLPLQMEDFKGLFRVMKGKPVTIRLIDPPLHEFLPKTEDEFSEMSAKTGVPLDDIRAAATSLHEANPMMGHRGCRLAITYPEIAVMQVKAIIGAAIEMRKEGIDVVPEIMIPLVGHVNEMRVQRELVEATADAMLKQAKVKMNYLVGTMIEVPRAALTAKEIAKEAEFFSFGTNDLTQMTFGFSRDDVGKFLRAPYVEDGILPGDPFKSVDRDGVGRLVKLAAKEGRQGRRKLKLGVCGEHGGDPESIHLFEEAGLDYVSASPFRVPVARLAAAQAAMTAKEKERSRTGTE